MFGIANAPKPLDPSATPAYTAAFPVSVLIPGVGLWNHLEHESIFVGVALTRQAGQPQQKKR
ncbi:hypothetical protein [Loktanella sp. PT4BL]|uniref:hypothetical protein n=1 Tax=Loktanella sp. PT4BL TaxID=2135611 RepID=UPI0011B415ED|nr:hypothetical protein [Loktanella sp. PT4BL]